MTMTATPWAVFLRELDWWIDKHDTAEVPQTATSRRVQGTPYPLGRRVNTARQRYNKGTLPAEQAAELEKRAGWRWRARTPSTEQTWQRNYDAVLDWYQTTGSLAKIHPSLLKWLQRQRRAAADKTLTGKRRQLLENIPGALEGTYSRADQFVQAAQAWLRDNPGKTMADITRNDTVELHGQTIRLQRRVTYYRGRHAGIEGSGPLTKDEVTKIEQLPGWTWTPSRGPHAPQPAEAERR